MAGAVAALALGGLAACGGGGAGGNGESAGSSGTATSADSPEVLTTFTILEDMTRTIAGDTLTVASLTSPGTEIHGYEPSPQDAAKAEKAQLIISNGLGLEHWVHKLTDNSPATKVEATTGIDPINIAGTDTPNPHAWMSPDLALIYVNNIVEALSQLKPEHAETYKDNAKNYSRDIEQVRQELHQGLAALPDNQRALVTCEGAFSYLAKDAHLKEGYIWPVNNEGDITSSQIRSAAEFVKDNHVPAVFCESTVEPGPKEQLIRDTGAADGGTLYVDSLSEASGPVPTYLDLLRYDARTIVEGLTTHAHSH